MTGSAEGLLRLPTGFLPALHRSVAHERPATEAAALLRQVGYEAGEAFYAALEETLAGAQPETPLRSVAPDEFWSGFAAFFRDLGWGTLHLDRIHPAVAALDSPDWAESHGRDEPYPACHVTTGLLADLLSSIAGSDVAVLEAECRARGDDRCRFLCASPAVLSAIHSSMRDGRPYTEALTRLA